MKIETSTFKCLVYIYKFSKHPPSVFVQPNMDILVPTNELPCAVLYNFLKAEIRTCSPRHYLSKIHQSQEKLETVLYSSKAKGNWWSVALDLQCSDASLRACQSLLMLHDPKHSETNVIQ